MNFYHVTYCLMALLLVSCWVVFYTRLPEKLISLIRNFRK